MLRQNDLQTASRDLSRASVALVDRASAHARATSTAGEAHAQLADAFDAPVRPQIDHAVTRTLTADEATQRQLRRAAEVLDALASTAGRLAEELDLHEARARAARSSLHWLEQQGRAALATGDPAASSLQDRIASTRGQLHAAEEQRQIVASRWRAACASAAGSIDDAARSVASHHEGLSIGAANSTSARRSDRSATGSALLTGTARGEAGSSQGPDGVRGLLRGLLAELGVYSDSQEQAASAVTMSRGSGSLRVARTVGFLRNMPPTAIERRRAVPTQLNGSIVRRLADPLRETNRVARWIRSPGAQTLARRAGAVGSAYGTVDGVVSLIQQGNPADAWQARGTHYAEDVASTAFSAASTAMFLAPNPVTAGAVVVTGVAYVGLSVWNRRERIASGFRSATRRVGTALNGAPALGTTQPVSGVLDAGRSVVSSASSALGRLNPFGS